MNEATTIANEILSGIEQSRQETDLYFSSLSFDDLKLIETELNAAQSGAAFGPKTSEVMMAMKYVETVQERKRDELTQHLSDELNDQVSEKVKEGMILQWHALKVRSHLAELFTN